VTIKTTTAATTTWNQIQHHELSTESNISIYAFWQQ